MELSFFSFFSAKAVAFQSLVGFKINWNMNWINMKLSSAMFQSLVGFKINWNYRNRTKSSRQEKFQSLVGFKINWNCKELAIVFIIYLVSIPSRV